MAAKSEALPTAALPAWLPAAAAMVGALVLSIFGWEQSALFLVGVLLGVTLYHSSFGFASAYRRLFTEGDTGGLVAQVVAIALACFLFAPFLAVGEVFGRPVLGTVAPVGLAGAVGALVFGIGMQLGRACGCGTLYTLGGGSLSMVWTLVAFCAGAFGATLTRSLWTGWPGVPPYALGEQWGWPAAVALQLVVLGGLAWALRHFGSKQSRPLWFTLEPAALLRGPWPPLLGAILLALLNLLTLLLSGQPWRVTWGFALAAAHFARFLGWNPGLDPFWNAEVPAEALSRSLLADATVVMDLGLVLGALLAASLSGRLAFSFRLPPLALAASLLGGLLMGYGAMMAAGCNVSAYFSGIASTSLHGWVWICFALVGTAVGIKLRPLFRL